MTFFSGGMLSFDESGGGGGEEAQDLKGEEVQRGLAGKDSTEEGQPPIVVVVLGMVPS